MSLPSPSPLLSLVLRSLAALVRRPMHAGLLWAALLAASPMLPRAVRAQGVDLPSISAHRQDGGVVLDFAANLMLSKAVEDALRRGVPVYFVAQATVLKPRWYWRDERVARVTRSWRLSYQPLTSAWRVSLGAFSQSYTSLEEALAAVTRLSHWRIADTGVNDAEGRYYVEFRYYLDASQLPRPMQLDLAAQADWHLEVARTVPVE